MKCIFCSKEINPSALKIRDGGRISLCKACCSRLADKGFLNYSDGKVVLKKPLMEVLSQGPFPPRLD